MSVIAEAEKLVLSLSERDRAELIGKILRSLPSPLSAYDDEDDGIAEALRRSDELKKNPEMGISIEELDRRMNERFGWRS
jgi:putative addiction module component (TIGR02574 family)